MGSDGARDLCALAVMFAMCGLQSGGARDEPSAFALLDEPDSRLDKRHSLALWRFLVGPMGPKQCLMTSLNNHGVLNNAIIQLAEARRVQPPAPHLQVSSLARSDRSVVASGEDGS